MEQHGLDPDVWDMPRNQDLNGFSSENSDGDRDVHAPPPKPCEQPLAVPDILRHVCSRSSSRNSGLQSRGSSKKSTAVQETARILEGFTAFKAKLAASHRQTMQLLDSELEKVRRLPTFYAVSDGSVTEKLQKPSRELREHRSTSKDFRLRLPGVLGHADDVPAVKEMTGTAPPTYMSISLPTAAINQRKRRMSWIHKSGSAINVEELQSAEQLDESELPDIAHLTRDEKQKAKKDATDVLHNGMLAQLNAEVAKENVRNKAAAEFGKTPTDVFKEEGFLAKLAGHPMFERITMTVIFLNAIWIGVDIELNHADVLAEADPGFIVAENLFCFFFSAELTIRFLLYTRKIYALRDTWFLFDLFLVLLMIVETWFMPLVHVFSADSAGASTGGLSVLRVARVMRVLRTARMARLVRFMPELMILVKGMMVAFRSVFFTLLLLLLVTYVFSVAFMQFSRGIENLETTLFRTMGTTVETLILGCVLTDQAGLIQEVGKDSPIIAALLIVFILVGSLTVMNMLLGVLVEAIKTVSTIEREQLEVDFAKRVLWEMISKGEADSDGDNKISEEEYMNVLRKPEAVTALTSLGVDVEAALDYGKLLFEDGEPLTFGDFMRGILTLRGSNQTTVKDIVDLRKFTGDEFSQVHEVLNGLAQFVMSQAAGYQPPQIQPTLSVSRRHSLASRSSNERESIR